MFRFKPEAPAFRHGEDHLFCSECIIWAGDEIPVTYK